jgi:hypothetical protein
LAGALSGGFRIVPQHFKEFVGKEESHLPDPFKQKLPRCSFCPAPVGQKKFFGNFFGNDWPGVNVMIPKIFTPEKIGKVDSKCCLLCRKCYHNIGYQEKFPKSVKITLNIDRKIDLRFSPNIKLIFRP